MSPEYSSFPIDLAKIDGNEGGQGRVKANANAKLFPVLKDKRIGQNLGTDIMLKPNA